MKIAEEQRHLVDQNERHQIRYEGLHFANQHEIEPSREVSEEFSKLLGLLPNQVKQTDQKDDLIKRTDKEYSVSEDSTDIQNQE